MREEHPIICPKCGKQVSTEEVEMFTYRQDDIKCPYCGAIVVSIPKVVF